MGRVRKFLGLSWSDRCLFLEAALFLALVRPAVMILPFRWIAPWLGHYMAESSRTTPVEHEELAERVGWCVRSAGGNLPGESRCLAQGVAGKLMLKRRGIPSTLYLGASKDEQHLVRYHAWLRSGSTIITGGPLIKQYTVVSTFADSE
jgi:hypothetical protein